MYKKILTIVALIALLTGCSKYIAPPFTDVDKISKLKTGMKFKQVVDILGIEPYNIYHLQDDNGMLVAFNYRLKKRRLMCHTINVDEYTRKTTNEESQTAGEVYYDKKYKMLYVLIKNDELKNFTTTSGLDASEFILIHNNNINQINKANVSQYKHISDTVSLVNIHNNNVIQSLQFNDILRTLEGNKKNKPTNEAEEESLIKSLFSK